MAAAFALTSCDGSASSPGVPSQYPTQCLPFFLGEPSDLQFCECHICQVYQLKTYSGGAAPAALENSIATTHLQPGVGSVHTLCLNHWTFFAIDLEASPAAVQSWQDPDIPERSTISAELAPNAPRQLTLTLDAMHDAEADRFTTVDAFLHTSPTLPTDWYKVHAGTDATGKNEDYPRIVFTPGELPDTSNHLEFLQRDSFMYTAGYDDTQPAQAADCHRKLPSRYYLAVRCGNPVPSKGSWLRQDKPCTFRVRYTLVPQQLRGGDVVGPLPMAPATTHGYSGEEACPCTLTASYIRWTPACLCHAPLLGSRCAHSSLAVAVHTPP